MTHPRRHAGGEMSLGSVAGGTRRFICAAVGERCKLSRHPSRGRRRTLDKEHLVTTAIIRRRVLIADNNVDLAQILGEIIGTEETLDFVGQVSSGAEALKRVGEEPIDVLVLDLGLADIHGFDVLDRLKRAGSPTRVIVHSGFSSPQLVAHARQHGAAAYVVKDGDVKALLAAIHAA
jgi:CheY-like chemotaxis protein